MSETGVDLAWKEIGDRSLQLNASNTMKPLADNHPLVMAERSIWEVRAAAKILLENIEDLSLHQSLLKRVQILASSIAELVTVMTEHNQTKPGNTSNILGSLIEQNNDPVLDDMKDNLNPSPSPPPFKRVHGSTNCLSFRSKHNLNKTAMVAQDLRNDLYKLTIDLTPFTPHAGTNTARQAALKTVIQVVDNIDICDTPIKRSTNGSKNVRRSSARLSSVLDELSALSHELSINLANQDTDNDTINHKENDEKIKAKEVLEKVKEFENKGNNSLRRMALQNVTNKIATPKVKTASPSPNISKTSILINSFERRKDIENVENKLTLISHCDVLDSI